MIGPAEIEDMMAEFAESIAWTGLGETEPKPACWPVFMAAEHLDEADRRLIKSPQHWVDAALRRT